MNLFRDEWSGGRTAFVMREPGRYRSAARPRRAWRLSPRLVRISTIAEVMFDLLFEVDRLVSAARARCPTQD